MALSDPIIVASCDSHVSPPLSYLRPYCEARLLEDFDAYAKGVHEKLDTAEGLSRIANKARDENLEEMHRRPEYLRVDYSDPKVRLERMDHERIAVEVVFHGTGQEEPETGRVASWPIPWQPGDRSLVGGDDGTSADLALAGRRIYNRWLADLCSAEPGRMAGLLHAPIWDMDEAVKELHWGKEHGLKGVNFPAPGSFIPAFDGPPDWALDAQYPSYESDYWDPFFATCVELNMPLTTHVGHPILPPYFTGPAAFAVTVFEQMPLSGRNLWHLIFGGVFDRHPDLKFVITEVLGQWVVYTMDNMDSMFHSKQVGPGPLLRKAISRPPSEYVRDNVTFGGSFMSRPEALDAIEHDMVGNFMWGSDWPHPEGTWYPDMDVDPVSPIALANTFHDLPEDAVRAMVGLNMVEVYDLDEALLTSVAERVGPKLGDILGAPDLEKVPAGYLGQGFRDAGGMFV
jgi:predicted TIM-barrel fold metal-dependent hydrolase